MGLLLPGSFGKCCTLDKLDKLDSKYIVQSLKEELIKVSDTECIWLISGYQKLGELLGWLFSKDITSLLQ